MLNNLGNLLNTVLKIRKNSCMSIGCTHGFYRYCEMQKHKTYLKNSDHAGHCTMPDV